MIPPRRNAPASGRLAHRGLVAVGTAAIVLASGCVTSRPDTTGGTTDRDPSAATADDTTSDERLTVAVPADVGPLNIFVQHEEWLTDLVYDKLVAPSPYVAEPQPWLASEVVAVDGSTWEVTVRDDVTWHDGEAFTAADVVFTFEYATAAPTGRWTHHITEIPEIASVELVDDDTVRFTCAFPCPELGTVTLADIPIIPEHVWSQVSPDQAREVTDLPIGTGPYRLVDYDTATGYRFEAYGDYFAGRPLVDELVMPVIEDASATFTALRTGEVDVAARRVPPELVDQFAASDDITVVTTAPLEHVELRMNYTKQPLTNHNFRRALALAVDKQELLDVVLLGRGRPATKGRMHPDSPWADPDAATPTDPGQAVRILDDAGYVDVDGDGWRETPEGEPIALTIEVNGAEPTHVRAGELVAEHLAEVGIAAEVVLRDSGTLSEVQSEMTFDLVVRPGAPHGIADPTQFVLGVTCCYAWDLGTYPYPEMAERVEAWKQAETLDARRQAIFAIQEQFNAQPSLIALYYPDEHWAYRTDAYDGFVESPAYGIVHKWSLLPHDVGRAANAIVEPDQ